MLPSTAFDSLPRTGEGSKGRGLPLGTQGRLAQWEERLVCNQKAGGSNPPASTPPFWPRSVRILFSKYTTPLRLNPLGDVRILDLLFKIFKDQF